MTTPTAETRRDDMLKPTVQINLPELGIYGSGVVIKSTKKKTWILTAKHVVNYDSEITVTFHKGRKAYKATIEKLHEEADLALITVKTGQRKVARFYGAKVRKMDEVYAIGFGKSLPAQLTHGFIAHVGKVNTLTTTSVTGGASGGGLFILDGSRYYFVGTVIAMGARKIPLSVGGTTIAHLDVPINHLCVSVGLETINDFLK